MLNNNALTTVDAVKRRAGIPLDVIDPVLDANIEDYINEVSQEIENIIGRPIKAADVVEYIDPKNDVNLLVKRYPINSVSAIHFVDGNTELCELVENEDFFLREPKAGMIFRSRGWLINGHSSYLSGVVNYPDKYVKVEYNGGYENVPSDIEGACKDIIANNLKLEDAQGLKSFSISDVSWTWDKEIDQKTMKKLKAYRGTWF